MSKEPEIAEKVGEFSSSIPEIFFDIIARVIPGAIAIVLYSKSISEPGIELNKMKAVTVGFGLICSYFFGILLSYVSVPFWHVLLFSWLSPLTKKRPFFGVETDIVLWNWFRGIRGSLSSLDRNIMTKMMAEKMMCANTSLIAVISFIRSPEILRCNFDRPRCVSVAAFFLLAFCMVAAQWMLTLNYDDHEHLKSNTLQSSAGGQEEGVKPK